MRVMSLRPDVRKLLDRPVVQLTSQPPSVLKYCSARLRRPVLADLTGCPDEQHQITAGAQDVARVEPAAVERWEEDELRRANAPRAKAGPTHVRSCVRLPLSLKVAARVKSTEAVAKQTADNP